MRMNAYVGVLEVCVLHGGGEDPAGVGQDVGQEQVGVDLVPQTPHLSEKIYYYSTFSTLFKSSILE